MEPNVTLNTIKRLTLAIAVAAALGACSKQAAAPVAAVPAANPAATPALALDMSKLPEAPHFNVADLDPNTPVCADLNGHVNGKWLAANPIPADKTSWGNFNILSDRSLGVQQQLVEAMGKGNNAAGSNEQKIGDLYRVGLDEARLNADGIAPVKPRLAAIDALADNPAVVQYLYDSFAHGDEQVFGFYPSEDFKDASKVT